jgi:hypothetical protein
MTKNLENLIRQLMNSVDGHWFHEGQEDFLEIAIYLLQKGLTEVEVFSVLSKAYAAVANEFGE